MKKRGFDETAILVGSVAKGTYLKNPDIDIFLRFPPDLSKNELKKLGIEIGKEIIPNGFAKYAEHPYWRGIYNGFEIDIVPCYKIDDPSKKISAVDRTPFHTEYIKSHLKEHQKDEVRLLKAFLKGIGAYGAEAKIQGFSGYLTELLILKYEDFINTLKNVSKWKKNVYLYLEKDHEKFKAPVIFIDPVDPKRNAASAVSDEKKSLFIYASKSYINEPKLEFFFPKNEISISQEEIRKMIDLRGTYFYVIKSPKPDIIEDNLYPQIFRTIDAFSKILGEFHVLSQFFIVEKQYVYFVLELEREFLPKVKIHEGPPVWHENSENFLKRWKNNALRGPYIKGYRWFVDIERTHITVKDVLLHNLKNYKLGKEFEKLKNEIEIDSLEAFLSELDHRTLTNFFKFRFPWEQ